ncbi:hypothetical protein [Bremerella cremea]|uniref:hypothetical protein n=1 Tax=Bremerella cremea TaxID=1031537 RepID=UPI0031EE100B
MNDLPNSIDDRMLDRLVDGELSPDEYRQVLVAVDQAPDGWRRCAHAFLESQALGQTLPLVMQPALTTSQSEAAPTVEASPPPSSSLSFHRMETIAAVAASVAIAFGLGWYISDLGGNTPGVVTPGPGPSTMANVVDPPMPADIPRHEVKKPQFVYVNQWDGQGGSGMPIPIDPTRKFNPEQNWDPTWGMSPAEVQKFQDAGHRLKTENRFIPVSMDDGQQVVVPVQDVMIYDQPALPYH